MKTIAIPLWGKEVAPRFGCADQILIVKVGVRYVGESLQITMNDELSWNQRLSILRQHNVEVLICAGFNNCFLPLAQRLGLRVERGVSGLVSNVVEQFANGTLIVPNTGCGQKHRHQKRHRSCAKHSF